MIGFVFSFSSCSFDPDCRGAASPPQPIPSDIFLDIQSSLAREEIEAEERNANTANEIDPIVDDEFHGHMRTEEVATAVTEQS